MNVQTYINEHPDDAEAMLLLSSMQLGEQETARKDPPFLAATQAMADLIEFQLTKKDKPDEHRESRIPIDVMELVRDHGSHFEGGLLILHDRHHFVLVGVKKECYNSVYYPIARWSMSHLKDIKVMAQEAIKSHLHMRLTKLLSIKAEVDGAIAVAKEEMKAKPLMSPSKRSDPSFYNS